MRKKTGQLISSEFEEHFAVVIGDRVFDRVTGPEGMPMNEYRLLFANAEDLLFEMLGEET